MKHTPRCLGYICTCPKLDETAERVNARIREFPNDESKARRELGFADPGEVLEFKKESVCDLRTSQF